MTQLNPHEDHAATVVHPNPIGENGETVSRVPSNDEQEPGMPPAKPKSGNGRRVSRAKPQGENGGRVSRAKPKSENAEKTPRAKTKRGNNGTEAKGKTKGENKTKGSEAKAKTKRAQESGGMGSFYKYLGAGICSVTLIGSLSFAILTYLRILDNTVYAYLIGPLQSLGLVVVTVGVYAWCRSLDFGRVLPWIWALGGLGLVLELNVFWPTLYTNLAIPSKLLGVISFVLAVFAVKFFFRKRGRISAGKRSSMMTVMVILFACLGSILPIASEFSYLLNNQLYAVLVEGMPTVGLMVLWPVEYLGLSGDVGISDVTGYGSWWNHEEVVDLATAFLTIGTNMVVYAAIAFVMGWIVWGRRISQSAS